MKHEEQELIQFGLDWDEAIVNNEAEAIEQYMSDDWVIISTNGILPKSRFLQLIRSGALTHNKMTAKDLRVKIYGNAGLISSRGISSGTYNGEPFEFDEWQTSIFVKKEEVWKSVLTMLTPVKK